MSLPTPRDLFAQYVEMAGGLDAASARINAFLGAPISRSSIASYRNGWRLITIDVAEAIQRDTGGRITASQLLLGQQRRPGKKAA